MQFWLPVSKFQRQHRQFVRGYKLTVGNTNTHADAVSNFPAKFDANSYANAGSNLKPFSFSDEVPDSDTFSFSNRKSVAQSDNSTHLSTHCGSYPTANQPTNKYTDLGTDSIPSVCERKSSVRYLVWELCITRKQL